MKKDRLIIKRLISLFFLPYSRYGMAQLKNDTLNKNLTLVKNKGFTVFNFYYDTRIYSVFTLNLLANLPQRFQYFSLTSYYGAAQSSDVDNFYCEQNLRWEIDQNIPIDLTFQLVLRRGIQNDDHHFGIRWRLRQSENLKNFFSSINLNYSINPNLIQFRQNSPVSYVSMIEHVYTRKLFPKHTNNRIYLSGFIDQNLIFDKRNVIVNHVTEHKLCIQLLNDIFFVVEYRLNTFLEQKGSGVGIGLEYKVFY